MEHDYSLNKQLRNEKTAGAVVNKKIKMLEIDINGNSKETYDVDEEIDTIQKTIRRRKQKNRKYRELSSRLIELKNLKAMLKLN